MTREGASSSNKKPLCTTFRYTFAGGDDERGGFTGEQLIMYPCKLLRHICARCGMMHRGERDRPYAGVRDDLLPPRKRSTFRRMGVIQLLLSLGSGGGGEEKKEAALPLEEGPSCWSGGSSITKGKRGPRRKRADLLCCELFKFE